MPKSQKLKAKNSSAFTLIELLVVISIICFLATFVTVSLYSSQLKARDTRRKHDLGQIYLVLENYYNDQSPNAYVVAEEEENIDGTDSLTAALVPDYTSELPQDPKAPEQYYHYQSFDSALSHRLEAVLEVKNDPDGEDDNGTWVYVLESD